MSIRASIRNHVLQNFLFTDDQQCLDDSSSLLVNGIIDSTGVLELVMYVEEAFGVVVEDDEIVPEKFDTIDGLVQYVQQKTKEMVPDAA